MISDEGFIAIHTHVTGQRQSRAVVTPGVFSPE